MEKDFLDLCESRHSLRTSIGHNECAGWCIEVYDKPLKDSGITEEEIIVSLDSQIRKIAFAQAYLDLEDALTQRYGN